MIKVKTFTLGGIGRFVDKQTIDFTRLGNLVQVDAFNKNTNGSSGSGKTTLFNGLEYNLGINDLAVTVLQSRLSEEGIFTLGEYEVDEKDLKLLRSKSKVTLEYDGNTYSGSKAVDEKLDQILFGGMDRKVFRPMLHKRQKEGGFFLEFTPAKMNDFLTSALDLISVKKKLEVVEAEFKFLWDQFVKTSNSRESAIAALDASRDALAALGEVPVATVAPEDIERLKAEWKAAERDWLAAEQGQKSALSELEKERPQTSIFPYDRAQIEAYERGINILKEKISQLQEQERSRYLAANRTAVVLGRDKALLESLVASGNKAKTEAVAVAAKIKKIRESVCPTCEQSWANDAAKAEESKLMEMIKDLRERVSSGAQAEADLVRANARLEELATELQERPLPEVDDLKQSISDLSKKLEAERVREKDHVSTQNAANNKIQAEFTAKQAEVRACYEQLIPGLRNTSVGKKYEYESAERKLKEETEAVARHSRMVSTVEAQIESHKNNVEKLSNELSDLKEKLEVTEEVKKAIKSYISCSFDDALEQIGDTATRIVRSIPNMANATIQLEGVRETKDGKVKEEVNAVISMDGEIGVPIKSLSGGERSAVDLAVDLAVIDLLENKTNKGIDIFILDEPFTGLDTVSIEMALDVLKNSNINKKLIIVDHNPEVKQMVESRLVVVREGTTSKIEQS
jgi:DNA repair exonuclease SbcCD ATPase subunit